MNKFIIFLTYNEGVQFIEQINSCMGYPSDGTITYYTQPVEMCEFDLITGNKILIGFGVPIKDFILDCMSEEQISEILILPSNINTCSFVVSGTTN